MTFLGRLYGLGESWADWQSGGNIWMFISEMKKTSIKFMFVGDLIAT
jgi:hypothetical protein